jgi:hypothetical protein
MNNFPNLEENEWFVVNLKKKKVADGSGKTFVDFDMDEFNCFTYAQGHTLWSLETSNPKNLNNCDETYDMLGFDRVYPDPKIPITKKPEILSDSVHGDMLTYEATHPKVIVYGRKDSWVLSPKPDFVPEHHVLRVPRGYEGKMGVLEALFHRTLAQAITFHNGEPFLLYRKR